MTALEKLASGSVARTSLSRSLGKDQTQIQILVDLCTNLQFDEGVMLV